MDVCLEVAWRSRLTIVRNEIGHLIENLLSNLNSAVRLLGDNLSPLDNFVELGGPAVIRLTDDTLRQSC